MPIGRRRPEPLYRSVSRDRCPGQARYSEFVAFFIFFRKSDVYRLLFMSLDNVFLNVLSELDTISWSAADLAEFFILCFLTRNFVFFTKVYASLGSMVD